MSPAFTVRKISSTASVALEWRIQRSMDIEVKLPKYMTLDELLKVVIGILNKTEGY